MLKDKIIPPAGSGRPRKYDFSGLKEYGDSAFFKTENVYSVRRAAFQYGKTHGIKIVTRAKTGGLRVYHAGTAKAKELTA
jgi:hypothetical protein